MREYVSEARAIGCPSAPENSIVVFDDEDRPQTRSVRVLHKRYTVSVGRVREDDGGIFDIKFVALSKIVSCYIFYVFLQELIATS